MANRPSGQNFPSLVVLVLGCCCFQFDSPAIADGPTKIRVLIDADTANEVDDLYAIVRALAEPRFDVVGLTASQFHTQKGAPRDSAQRSQQLNEDILRLMDRREIPHAAGSNEPLSSGTKARDSAAARLIIQQAHATPEGQRLNVLVLGSMTNLASALILDPAIVAKLRVGIIGLRYEDGHWIRNEFNHNNDPLAANVLFETPGLDLSVMTATASFPMIFKKDVTDAHLKGRGGIADFLVKRWEDYNRIKTWASEHSNDRQWVMWDVALVEAVADPSLATCVDSLPPSDIRNRRKIRRYDKIDHESMQKRYWEALETWLDSIVPGAIPCQNR